MNDLTVETRDSDVNCPVCGERMHKKNHPLDPLPSPSEVTNAMYMTRYYGLAFCNSCQDAPRRWSMRR